MSLKDREWMSLSLCVRYRVIRAPGIVIKLKAEVGQVIKVGQTLCDIHEEDGEGGEIGDNQVDEVVLQNTEDDKSESAGIQESEEVARAERLSEELEKRAEEERKGTLSSVPDADVDSESTSTDSQSTAKFVSTDPQSTANMDREQANEDHSIFASRDEAMDLSGGSRFSGEGSILPSPPRPGSSSSNNPIVERRVETSTEPRKSVKASPAVRTLAAKLGVDLGQIVPEAEDGRVRKEDVERFAGGVSSGIESERSRLGGDDVTVLDRGPEIVKVPFGRTRRVMWKAMGSMGNVPHFGYSHTLDLTCLIPYMKALNPPPSPPSRPSYLASDLPLDQARDPLGLETANRAIKTTLLSVLVKALLLALEEHPIMRSRAVSEGDVRELEIRRDAIVGIAVSDPKLGLLTPSLPALPPWTALSDLTSHLAQIRQNPSKPSASPNITISSVGALGESAGLMPVLPPGGGVAICAVGRAKWEVEWAQGQASSVWELTPGEVERGGTKAVLRCPVGWSGDHRVLEGAELIAFTQSWKKYVEEPWRWLKVDG
ncbi:2-oxoacid dehydrogenases acyltransferase-domain-containing protein [Naematelia encephala]|uniref:2-oxoacid dehydrogenases acyltransferase-domain-containing protein n=1 Tax=Naematelia encephala TaxID=71784 RepID=A0A1Y2AXN5_9TREE|nr:2-oxoacid dehydrogenases acyltransferase-domain-containing protein [Naematelia encephala]